VSKLSAKGFWKVNYST